MDLEIISAALPHREPLDDAVVKRVVAALCAGINGDAYTFRRGYGRSLWTLCRAHGLSDAAISRVECALRETGFAEAAYLNNLRKRSVGIRAPDGRPDTVRWIT